MLLVRQATRWCVEIRPFLGLPGSEEREEQQQNGVGRVVVFCLNKSLKQILGNARG
jgi:hypothetical protein